MTNSLAGWVIVVLILALAANITGHLQAKAINTWKYGCANGDPTPLVTQLNQNGAQEVIVLDYPHGRSDTMMTSSNRMCVLFR